MGERPKVFAADRLVQLVSNGDRHALRFDWQGMGCPERLCVALGDQVIGISLPDRFPEHALDFKASPSVYERKQSFKLTSAADQPARDVLITLTVEAVDVPFALLWQEGPLVDGYEGYTEWEDGIHVGEIFGVRIKHRVRVIPDGFEKEMVTGAACRPPGRKHSVLVSRLEYPATEERREFVEEGGEHFLKKHYVQVMSYTWHTFECENGKWTQKGVLHDRVERRFALRAPVF